MPKTTSKIQFRQKALILRITNLKKEKKGHLLNRSLLWERSLFEVGIGSERRRVESGSFQQLRFCTYMYEECVLTRLMKLIGVI